MEDSLPEVDAQLSRYLRLKVNEFDKLSVKTVQCFIDKSMKKLERFVMMIFEDIFSHQNLFSKEITIEISLMRRILENRFGYDVKII